MGKQLVTNHKLSPPSLPHPVERAVTIGNINRDPKEEEGEGVTERGGRQRARRRGSESTARLN